MEGPISSVSKTLRKGKSVKTMVLHTSGSVPSAVLDAHDSYGVLYPFQSMTAGQDMDFKEVPVLVYSNSPKGTTTLLDLSKSISGLVYEVSDEQRSIIHIAGVFANNFTNHMIALSKEILDKNELPFDIVKPLIVNTLQKILDMDPIGAQTGPAVRGDQAIISKHLALLDMQPDKKALYQMVSKSIVDLHESKGHRGS